MSAVSQTVSFATFDALTAEDILQMIKASAGAQAGRLNISACFRVPRVFHPLFSASWRRYLYIFPLNSGRYEFCMAGGKVEEDEGKEKKEEEIGKEKAAGWSGVDVDVTFVNEALRGLENKRLQYNGFAYRENRQTGEGMSDVCELYRARAFVVDIFSSSSSSSSSSTAAAPKQQLAMCVELVGDRFLRQMVRILVATVIRESVVEPAEVRDQGILLRIATAAPPLVQPSDAAAAEIAAAAAAAEDSFGANTVVDDPQVTDKDGSKDGNVAVVTGSFSSSQPATSPPSSSSVVSGTRYLAASAVTGAGLALCGVGYDLDKPPPHQQQQQAKEKVQPKEPQENSRRRQKKRKLESDKKAIVSEKTATADIDVAAAAPDC